jgi:hypothetical protein
VHYFALHPLLR